MNHLSVHHSLFTAHKNTVYTKTIILLVMVLCACPLAAQITHTKNGDVDKNAQKILSSALKKIDNASAVSFKVTLVSKNAEKKETARQTVQVLYSKGKYRVSADDQMLYSNGVDAWHWTKSNKEVVVSPLPASEDDLMNPARLLANYSKNFRPKFIRVENDGTAVIDLIPIRPKSYHKIRLLIVEKTGLLKKMEMHNYDSSCGEYIISDFKNAKASASDFVFDVAAHKDVEVIDMR